MEEMMKTRKITALLLALALSAASLSGCGSGDGSEKSSQADNVEASASEDSSASEDNNSVADASTDNDDSSIVFPLEEKLSFTGFSVINGETSLDENLAWQALLDMANIDVELTSVLPADRDEKRNLMLSGGEYPDFFYKSGMQADANKYGMQGVLIPLEDLMHTYAPNFCRLMDETNGWQYITAADGHVYSFPSDYGELPHAPLWINKRWMDNLNLEEPKSFEELYEVLKAFKEQDANGNGDPDDEIPLAIDSGILNWIYLYADYLIDPNKWVAEINGTFSYVPTDDTYKEFMAYCARLYAEGLVNQDMFTITGQQLNSNGQAGDIYGAFRSAASFLVVGRDNDDDYIVLKPFQAGTYPLVDRWTLGSMIITDHCEHPEVLVALMDYFYTEEGARLHYMGVEGKSYEVYEDGTWGWILGGECGEDITTVRAKGALSGGSLSPGMLPQLWQNMSTQVDPDEVYMNVEKAKVAALGAHPPYLVFTDEENAQLATIEPDVNGYLNEYFAQVVTGAVSLEESWQGYIDTLKQMGLDTMVSIYQAAYERATE